MAYTYGYIQLLHTMLSDSIDALITSADDILSRRRCAFASLLMLTFCAQRGFTVKLCIIYEPAAAGARQTTPPATPVRGASLISPAAIDMAFLGINLLLWCAMTWRLLSYSICLASPNAAFRYIEDTPRGQISQFYFTRSFCRSLR